MIKDMEWGLSGTKMAIHMKDFLKMERPMEKVNTCGTIMSTTKVAGKMDSSMARENGIITKESHILVTGKKIKLMVRECTTGQMGIGTKETGWIF